MEYRYNIRVSNLHQDTTDADLQDCFPDAFLCARLVDRTVGYFYRRATIYFRNEISALSAAALPRTIRGNIIKMELGSDVASK